MDSKPASQPLALRGPWFVEPETDRILLLRGINLSGGTKLPYGIPSHERDRFWVDYDRYVSFVGRPFPIDEADEHLDRLKDWGFTFLRFVVTWEALEHEGPGIYDQEYIEYVVQVLKKCKRRGIRVFIDPHQDVWSRHTGGSGHPGWTLALAGLNPNHFAATNAALVHNMYPVPSDFPKMVWATNYFKLAAGTMFTLFWSGATFAPLCTVDDVSIQDYLQSHYINAICALARRIHQETDDPLEDVVVVGYDTMNEPGQGFIAQTDLAQFSEKQDLKKDLSPTPFQAFQLGVGFATTVEKWDVGALGPQKKGTVLVDPRGESAWLTDAEVSSAQDVFGWRRAPTSRWPVGCIWAAHDVWSPNTRSLLRSDYFATDPVTKQHVNFDDFWMPYVKKFSEALRQVHREAIIFLQPPFPELPPRLEGELGRVVYTPHWYDGLTLINKEWNGWNVDFMGLKRGKYGDGVFKYVRAIRVGEKAVRQCFVEQLALIKAEGKEYVGDYPCLIGEIGIPYDMKSSTTFRLLDLFTHPFRPIHISDPTSPQSKAMDANLHALESNLLHFTLWNYVPDNDEQWGDRWNGEDLSLWQGVGGDEDTMPGLWKDGYKRPPVIRSESQEPLMMSEEPEAATTVVVIPPEMPASEKVRKRNSLRASPDDRYAARGFLSPQERVVVLDDDDANSAYTVIAHEDIPLDVAFLVPGEKFGDGSTSAMSSVTNVGTVVDTVPKKNARDIPPIHRPHPVKIAGLPKSVAFVMTPTPKFEFSFETGSVDTVGLGLNPTGPTEVYIPKQHFPVPLGKDVVEEDELKTEVMVSIGEWRVISEGEGHWIVGWWVGEAVGVHEMVIERREKAPEGWNCIIL
ncbi:glycoside hydrolase superfamily [Jimgerdemannia flammicorona]|uniref:Glycoside hydrolase superfamily n=1 Tax=Jimgerdemannia flammicorona TaxID=994334 RepID=A0A433B9D0_9FUNG|nr:glycoside hydrolase superfamily [Jimgerdemannia flammicorona]